MSRRTELGSSRVVSNLDECGVCWRAIPVLKGDYKVIGVEQIGLIGRAPKDLVRFRDGRSFIAKKPVREHSSFRECVTEYVMSEIGKMLPLNVARGSLARLPTRQGERPDVRFLSLVFTKPGDELVHGVELVAQSLDIEKAAVETELTRKRDERAFYSVDIVDDLLEDVADGDTECHGRLRGAFIRMLTFDALLGASDRHASNWGIVQDMARVVPPRFSPVFDTARGLLGEIDDNLLSERRNDPMFIEKYAERAKPLIGAPGNPDVNHFALTEHLARVPLYRKHVLSVIHGYHPLRVRRMLHQRFRRVVAPVRLESIARLLNYRWTRLKKLVSV